MKFEKMTNVGDGKRPTSYTAESSFPQYVLLDEQYEQDELWLTIAIARSILSLLR